MSNIYSTFLNALQIGLRWGNLPSSEEADEAVGTRERKLKAPLQDFLLSRADAGATHEDLLQGIKTLTSGNIIGHFFHMHPIRPPDMFEWMTTWMKMGAVLVASLNLQQAVPDGVPVPDAWHHQMIYGVIETGVFTLNPHEFIPFPTLLKQLSSESIIKIKAEDIIKRWSSDTDMTKLSQGRWVELDVVKNINRLVQSCTASNQQCNNSHVTIPASYKSGITVFCTVVSDAGRTLLGKQ